MRKHGRIRGLLALGSVVGLGIVGTWAVFSDQASFTTTIETGTLDISFDNDQQGPISQPYVVADLESSNAKPGDVTYGALTVNNDGSLDFTYSPTAVNIQGATDMDAAVSLAVRVVGATGDCSASGWSSGNSVLGNVSSFSSLTGMTPRTLAAQTSEVLCFQWTLSSAAGNTLQGQTFSPIVTFTANPS